MSTIFSKEDLQRLLHGETATVPEMKDGGVLVCEGAGNVYNGGTRGIPVYEASDGSTSATVYLRRSLSKEKIEDIVRKHPHLDNELGKKPKALVIVWEDNVGFGPWGYIGYYHSPMLHRAMREAHSFLNGYSSSR